MIKIPKFVRIWICSGILLFAWTANSVAEVELPEGEFYLDYVDLKVKVLGGFVSVQRTWYQGQWHFNRAWADPELEIDAYDGSIKSITRNGDLYAINQLISGQFFFDDRLIFEPAPSGGFRWKDRHGNFIDYAPDARIAGYGNRNDIGVSFGYDTQGRRNAVFDHLGNQILWLEYGLGDDRITAVQDASTPEPRRVEYEYQGQNLYQVRDATEETWTYEYTGDGSLLKRIIDPETRPLTISYYDTGRVKSVKRSDDTGPSYTYSYDATAQEYYVSTSQRSGRLEEQWFDKDGEVIRRDVNGNTVYTMYKEGRSRISEDDVGNVTVRNYDQWDNLIGVKLPDRAIQRFAVDPNYSQPLQDVNERDVTTRYEYDDKGNLKKKIEAFNLVEERVTEYDYDQYGNLWKKRTLADDNTELAETVYTYDLYGNVDTVIDAEDNLTDYLLFDTMGNPLQWRDGRGKLWQRSYDELGRMLTETNPLGHVKKYEYDGAGNQIKVTDAEDNVTETRIDNNYRRYEVIDADSNVSKFVYDAAGILMHKIDQEGKKVTLVYDNLERFREQFDSAGNTLRYHYGEIGSGASYMQISRTEHPTYTEQLTFDSRGRRTRSVMKTIDNGDFTTQYSYDSVGNLISQTDAENRTTNYKYDALNRIVEEINPLEGSTKFTYDDRDNLLSVTNENDIVIRSFTFDRINRVKTETWPNGNTWYYDYDEANNLIRQQDGKGQVVKHFYDDAGRRYLSEYFPDATATTPQKTVTFGHDKLGHVTAFDNGEITGSITYDKLLRKSGESIQYPGFSKNYQYSYYKNGKLFRYTDPELRVTEYSYDSANRLKTIKLPGNRGTIVYADYRWSKPTKIAYPGGVERNMVYDELQRITDIEVRDPADNLLMDYHYSYDRMDNVDSKSTEHGNYSFDYDLLDRLISATNPTLPDESYDYDPSGNRILADSVSGPWEYNDDNQLQTYGFVGLQYDDNGSTRLKNSVQGNVSFEFNLENRLSRISNADNDAEIASYHYDPFGRRLWKEVDGVRTYFFYTEEGLVAEYDAAGTEIRHYIHESGASNGIVPVFVEQAGTAGFYHLDHLGTPKLIVAGAGNLLWSGQASAFGQTSETLNLIDNPLRFPGQYFDVESGLHYNRFRYYEPSTGRYISSDPISLAGGNNTYQYAASNPLKYADPRGLDNVGCSGIASVLNNNPCALLCCAQHDKCFDDYQCTQESLLNPVDYDGCNKSECLSCNSNVVRCLGWCGIEDLGEIIGKIKGLGPIRYPGILVNMFFEVWDDDEGPDLANVPYYCARQRRYVYIPGDFSSFSEATRHCGTRGD